MEPESEGHAPPPRENSSEDQPTCEHAGQDAEQRDAALQVEQREDTRCRDNSDVWTKAIREPNKGVASIDQLFSDIVEEAERTGAKETHAVEGWIRNAFDKEYVPMAIPYEGLAPSGFLGESGAPMTMGVSVGLRF